MSSIESSKQEDFRYFVATLHTTMPHKNLKKYKRQWREKKRKISCSKESGRNLES